MIAKIRGIWRRFVFRLYGISEADLDDLLTIYQRAGRICRRAAATRGIALSDADAEYIGFEILSRAESLVAAGSPQSAIIPEPDRTDKNGL